MRHRSLASVLTVAGAGVLAGCGQGGATPSPSPTIPAGCNTPAGFVFTDGSGQANVTWPAPAATTSTTRSAQRLSVTGVWTEPFESSQPNDRYDPAAFRGSPWLNLNLGSATNGLVIEVQGQDPCALSPDGSHSYVAVVFGRESTNRYGAKCSVIVDAFNSAGFRGRFNCPTLQQFSSNAQSATAAAQGSFAATGHVYTPTPAPTATPSRSAAPTSLPTATPIPQPTSTPATTPTSLVSP